MEVPKSVMRKKKSQEDEQTVAELNSAHRRSQAKCQPELPKNQLH